MRFLSINIRASDFNLMSLKSNVKEYTTYIQLNSGTTTNDKNYLYLHNTAASNNIDSKAS